MDIAILSGSSMAGLLAAPGELVSVADRAEHAFAGAFIDLGKQRRELFIAGQDPIVAANPVLLSRYQVALAEHTQKVNLAAALTHHVTEGIETLLKS